jgi:hypothetical protein
MASTTLVDDRPVHTPLTAAALLFGAGSQTAEALGQAISQRDATRTALRSIRRLSSSAAGLVDREVATVTDGLLDLDLGDVLIAAWQQHSKLTEAARRTLAISGSEEIVSLASHSIQSTYSPHVDLVVNGALVHCFKFVLEIVVDVAALDAVVRAGSLAMLRSGECVMTATLALAGGQLASARRTADLELIVGLHPPRPLITSSVAA